VERKNLWAPWRMEYIRGLSTTGTCFLCDDIAAPDRDAENFVLWRTEHGVVVFNRFPYNNGHMLIAPRRHIATLAEANDIELLELLKLTRDVQAVLQEAIAPHGFNIGINFGRCAGAGLPDHLHIHLVPRWDGDTNYMAVCAQTDVISQSLHDLYAQLQRISRDQGYPRL
jgi:ATP adenylyltransferase